MGPSLELRNLEDGVEFWVHLQPRASKDNIGGCQDRALRVRVQAPAVESKANRSLCQLLARGLGVRQSSVRLVSGERRRRKRVRISGDPEALCRRLKALAAGDQVV